MKVKTIDRQQAAERWREAVTDYQNQQTVRHVAKYRLSARTHVISIPVALMRQIGVKPGDYVEMAFKKGDDHLEIRFFSNIIE